LLSLVFHTLLTMIQVFLAEKRRGPCAAQSARALQQWCKRLVSALGLHVQTKGKPPQEGVLIVANHRSYIDIGAIGALVPCSFLAKQELAGWPLLGYGARRFGNVLFVSRKNEESRKRARAAVAAVLKGGVSVVVFPEGTTRASPGILPFKQGIFQTAAAGGFTVLPAAIEYEDPADAWVGDDTFVGHFLRTFSKRRVSVHLSFGEAIRSEDPNFLMETAWNWIAGNVYQKAPS
jgi:1-acyl-sn-glycerol-3-phosphate acyltransferase